MSADFNKNFRTERKCSFFNFTLNTSADFTKQQLRCYSSTSPHTFSHTFNRYFLLLILLKNIFYNQCSQADIKKELCVTTFISQHKALFNFCFLIF